MFFLNLPLSLQTATKTPGYEEMGWIGDSWKYNAFIRNVDSVSFTAESQGPPASTWQFWWRMLFYSGDKLQVSLVALGEHFTGLAKLSDWEPGLWLTAAPDRAQSLRSAAATSSRSRLPMKASVLLVSHPLIWSGVYIKPYIFLPSYFSLDDEWGGISQQSYPTHNFVPVIVLLLMQRFFLSFCLYLCRSSGVLFHMRSLIFSLDVPWRLCRLNLINNKKSLLSWCFIYKENK